MASDRGGLEQALEGFIASFEGGSEEWFDYFSPDVSVYGIGAVEPINGREAYQANFGKLLAKEREVRVLKRDVQEMGDTAVAMHLLEVTQDDVVTILREGSIWRRGDGGWQVVHLNASLATDPVPAERTVRQLRDDLQSIKVLRARLATTSVQVGLAQ